LKRYGLVIDLERCSGCHTCRIACKTENNMNISSGIRVDTIGGPHRDTPAGKYPDLTMYFRPVLCMHCDEPPCIDACPLEAIYKREDGIVVIDDEKCTGCQECITACPYEIPFYDEEKDVARKCSLCAHRIDQGLEPFCVICCESEALLFGDLNDPSSKVSQIIAQRKDSYTLKPEVGTKPAIYYSPMRTVKSTRK
jgi:Fe-S-cluster-containing dehydrogenase component